MIPSGATQLPPKGSLSSTVLVAPPCRVYELLLGLVVEARIEDTSSLGNEDCNDEVDHGDLVQLDVALGW